MKFLRVLAGVLWLLKFTLTLAVKRVKATQRNAMQCNANMQVIWAGWVDKALEVTGVKEEK
jgi:hypothetical protein